MAPNRQDEYTKLPTDTGPNISIAKLFTKEHSIHTVALEFSQEIYLSKLNATKLKRTNNFIQDSNWKKRVDIL